MDVLNEIDEKYSTLSGQTAVWSLSPKFPIILFDFLRQKYLKIGNFSMVPFPKKGEIYISESVAKVLNVFFFFQYFQNILNFFLVKRGRYL
jgi:hypothetical protein